MKLATNRKYLFIGLAVVLIVASAWFAINHNNKPSSEPNESHDVSPVHEIQDASLLIKELLNLEKAFLEDAFNGDKEAWANYIFEKRQTYGIQTKPPKAISTSSDIPIKYLVSLYESLERDYVKLTDYNLPNQATESTP